MEILGAGVYYTFLNQLFTRTDRFTWEDNMGAMHHSGFFTRKRPGSLPLRFEVLEDRTLLSGIATPDYVLFHPPGGGGGGGVAPFGSPSPTGLSPSQIRHAYGFDQMNWDGTGTTIAIVDAFDDPKIATDLQAFDAQFGLPNPVFTKVNQTGGSTPPAANGGWAVEIALDVQWAHAIAPGANILLVEANDNSFANLNTAVSFAASQPGVVAVSMSWGGGEFGTETIYDSTIFFAPSDHGGVTFVASSGDTGAPPSYPAISPYVLSVGGTTLNVDSAGNYISESGWIGSGGGISTVESQPAYQNGVVTQSTTFRTNPDVAYDADPNTGFSIYDSYNNGTAAPWSQVGGTSAGAPQWAALIAVADQARIAAHLTPLNGSSETLSLLYKLSPADLHDITTGGSGGSPALNAGPGYDLVTGLGTPLANKVVPDLLGQSSDLLLVVQDPGTSNYHLQERRPSGALVNSIPIPLETGPTEISAARGISVDPSGNVNLFNGSFTPVLSNYSVATQTWTNRTTSGWSTVANISYGGVATYNNFVFVTDMVVNGQPLDGLIRFDSSGGPTTLFANGHDFIDVTLGLDGLIYGLTDDVPNQVYVFNPQSLAPVRNFALTSPLASDTRSIAVDAGGNIYAVTWGSELLKVDSTGANVLASIAVPGGDNLLNIGLDSNGTIAVGGRDGRVFVTNQSLTSVTPFATNEWNVFVTFNHYIGSLISPLSFWGTYGENAQHTALAAQASQSLDVIHWATPVNLTPYTGGSILIHYATPLITPNNTVLVPVMTTTGGFQITAINAVTGQTKWTLSTDYITPPHNWVPSYDASLVAPNATDPNFRLYFAGAGGTLYYIDNPDSNTAPTVGQVAYYGIANYNANPGAFNSSVYINTPITADNQGDIFFGVRVTGSSPPLGLASGVVRMDANGNGSWVSARSISGDPNIAVVPHQAAPALSNDQSTLYVSVRSASTAYYGYLLGLNSTTLATKYNSGILKDPRNGGVNNAGLLDDSSAAPMVGPDGNVFYGVFGNPYNGSRGWMLQFSGDLTTEKTPGAFGWDDTASIVPASMVPSYTGTSSYLIFTKYNNYVAAEVGPTGGDGVNKIAILDPNASQTDTRNDGTPPIQVMQEILTIAGPTPDPWGPSYPNAVREWCINTAVVDPFTKSVLVNSEDGNLYRWDLTTNTLSQVVTLSPGVGEAYTPTAMGPDGTVYAINQSILDAVGRLPAMAINNVSAAEGNSGTTAFTFTVNLDYSSTQTITVNYSTADGTATTADGDYQAASGTLTFAPGVMSQTITVLVNGNTAYENNETFTVNLTGPGNATISTATGVGTIQNDDPAPQLAINNVSQLEGNSGTTAFTFTVTLTGATEFTTTVNYATADGTAKVANGDYQAASGTLTFNPGVTSQTITVLVNGNNAFENNETFTVNLTNPTNATITTATGTGTIQNDDPAPTLSINNVTMNIGANGTTTNFVFTVTLTGATELPATVNYATADGTATLAEGDYVQTSGQLTFNPGVTTQSITVVANGNSTFEADETFLVNLTNPVNSTIATGTGTGTIHSPVGVPPHIDYLSGVPFPGSKLLLRAVNVTDPDDAVVSVSYYIETNGTAGLQTGTGGDTLLFVATASPWNAIVLFRIGTYYAQAIDASGLLSNVVQLNLKLPPPPPPPPPPPGFGPGAPAPLAGASSVSTNSSLWNGATNSLTWMPTGTSNHYASSTPLRVATGSSATAASSLWDVLNPIDQLITI